MNRLRFRWTECFLLLALLPLAACTAQQTAQAEVQYQEKYRQGLVVVYFWGQKCPSCKKQLEELAKFEQNSQVSVEKLLPDASTIRKYKLTRTPTLIFLNNGREVDRREGVTYEDQLQTIVRRIQTKGA